MIIFFHLAVRGVIYWLFYKLWFLPKLTIAKFNNKSLLTSIRIRNFVYSLFVHPQEGGFAEDVYFMHIREYPNVLYFEQYIRSHSADIYRYIGVGSNVGYYAVLAHKLLNLSLRADNKFYFFEPVKETFRRFIRNLRLNRIPQEFAHNLAIGDKNGLIPMVVTKSKNLSHIASTSHRKAGDMIQNVRMVRLDTFFSKNDIPKSNVLFRWDIEGYEYNVVKGNAAFFKSLKRAYIIMEFHPFFLTPHQSQEMLEILEASGFRIDQVISCEPLYFLKVPKPIRKLLIWSFLKQHKGEALGLLPRYKAFSTLIHDLNIKNHALYHYPNLHIYMSKRG